jgi:hypothetical protein
MAGERSETRPLIFTHQKRGPVSPPGLLFAASARGSNRAQFGLARPAPLQRGQSGSESLTTFLGCGRTALPVPPHAWQKSFVTAGFGFFKITLAKPLFLRKECERGRDAVGGTGKPKPIATPWLVSRAPIQPHESYRLPKQPKNVTARGEDFPWRCTGTSELCRRQVARSRLSLSRAADASFAESLPIRRTMRAASTVAIFAGRRRDGAGSPATF